VLEKMHKEEIVAYFNILIHLDCQNKNTITPVYVTQTVYMANTSPESGC
jgi:hypothetical protein